MKRALITAGLAAAVFLAVFAPTFILVARGLANTTLASSVDINDLNTNQPLPQSNPVPVPPPALHSTTTVSTSSMATTTKSSSTKGAKFTTITVNGQSYSAEISDTSALQQLGLSYRPSLPANQVMLFIFPVSSTWGIWMKGMEFPLDIMWLDTNGTVVDLQQNVSPSTYPNIFTPQLPAKYVIEANVGWIAANNVVVGTTISIQ